MQYLLLQGVEKVFRMTWKPEASIKYQVLVLGDLLGTIRHSGPQGSSVSPCTYEEKLVEAELDLSKGAFWLSKDGAAKWAQHSLCIGDRLDAEPNSGAH
jgi:hypothetical protein